MSQRISQRELAHLAGVSAATVSRALSDHPAISQEVAHRIKALARKMDYRPSAAARSFVTRRHTTIGLVICDRPLSVTVYAVLASTVEQATRDRGLKLQLTLCDSGQFTRDQLPPLFQDDGVDGVILTGAVPDWLLERLRTWRMPCVLLGSQPGLAGVSQVTGDARQAGRLAADHLLEQGHRDIGLLLGPRTRPMHKHYFLGFRDGCLEAGFEPRDIEAMLVECTSNDAVPPMRQLISRRRDLTALFANTDLIAWQAVQFLRAIGRDVPGQVSVIGAGGTVGDPTHPASTLTSVDVRLPEMARAAVQLLQEMIERPDTPSRRIVIDPHLSVGQTVAPRGASGCATSPVSPATVGASSS